MLLKKSVPRAISLKFIIPIVIVLITLFTYGDVRHHQFINFDDNEYIYENSHVKNGMTLEGVGWAFSFSNIVSYWHPLSWISHMLDCQFFGLLPGAHHLVNLVFHILNSLLLFFILLKMTGAPCKSGLVALLFAVHPLNVESVAWVTERKTLLSTMFFLSAVYTYIRYTESKKTGIYLATVGLYTLGLMSKPSIIILPFLLFIMDKWPLKRFSSLPSEAIENFKKANYLKYIRMAFFSFWKSRTGWILLEKVPFFLIAFVSYIISTLSLAKNHIVIGYDLVPLDLRIYNLMVSIEKYLWQILWPVKLSIFYPYPKSVDLWDLWLALIAIIMITGMAIIKRKDRPWLATGWFWFLIALAPASGLVQAGLWPSMASRFMYIPMMGVFLMIVWEGDAWLKGPYSRVLKTILCAVVLIYFVSLTRVQNIYFSNSYALFQRANEVTGENFIACNNIGDALVTLNRLDEAAVYFKRAISLNPKYDDAFYNYGLYLAKKGDFEGAVTNFSQAIKISPRFVAAYVNLAIVRYRMGDSEEAGRIINQALSVDPDDANAHNNKGIFLAVKGLTEEAILHFLIAQKNNPELVPARVNLAEIYEKKGMYEQTIIQYKALIQIKPADKGVTYYRIAGVYSQQKKFKECEYYLEMALKNGDFNALDYLPSDKRFKYFRETPAYGTFLENHKIKIP